MSIPASIERQIGRRDAALRFLYDRIDYERTPDIPYQVRDFRLDRMRDLLDRAGNPQDTVRIVHVAGTKGKGSTARMIQAVLSAAGHRTGTFTSPHLYRIEERMAVDGQPCSSGELVELVDLVRPIVAQMDQLGSQNQLPQAGPTYFEITTAMALLHFARRNADIAVLEVGLGGRLDSTNVCRPEVSVITSISLDHTLQLGNTLESIAAEKAGIIKPGVPVVSGVTDSGPRDVIREACRQRDCRLIELGEDFDFQYRAPTGLERAAAPGALDFTYRVPGQERAYRDVPLSLLGRHQAANAAVAIATIAQLQSGGSTIGPQAIQGGLADLSWPARVEVMARRPAVVVDAAHNAASVAALVDTLNDSFSVRQRLLVFATTVEKDISGMLDQALGRFDKVLFTRYLNNPRAVPPEELAAIAKSLTGRSYPVFARPADAWEHVCRLAGPDDLICVAGSFFIAAEMRHEIQSRPYK
jgi:dihydrofolate synthase / folylpolyglutamate synthase